MINQRSFFVRPIASGNSRCVNFSEFKMTRGSASLVYDLPHLNLRRFYYAE